MLNVIFFYRIARWLYLHHIPFIPKIIQLFIFLCYACNIPYKCSIGKGTFFNHGGIAVLLNPNVEIGNFCKIGNSVSIVGQGPYKNAPKLGNRVYVGPSAIIQGPVIIEDNVIIAPNSVVNMSVPKNAIVAGVPAKIIGWTNLLDYDIFENEDWKEGYKPFLKSNQETSNSI